MEDLTTCTLTIRFFRELRILSFGWAFEIHLSGADMVMKTRELENERSPIDQGGETVHGHSRADSDELGSPAQGPVLRAGDGRQWLDPNQLRASLLDAIDAGRAREDDGLPLREGVAGGRNIVVDLSGLEHLDAAVLEVLLAAARELRGRGGRLRLEHCSESLERWFGYAGAEELRCGDGQSGVVGPTR